MSVGSWSCLCRRAGLDGGLGQKHAAAVLQSVPGKGGFWGLCVCERSHVCLCVGKSYLTQQLIHLLLGLCLSIILKILLFLFPGFD